MRPVPGIPTSAAAGLLAVALAGCDGASPQYERVSAAVVHGADDRREYFETEAAARLLMDGAMVALMSRSQLVASASGLRVVAPALADKAELCAGEPFGEQPAAAFCSGVLVDRDLVLTAAHCAHALPLDDVAVVSGYHYREPGALQLQAGDVHGVKDIVAERESPAGRRPHFDFAWLRLDRAVWPPRAPVAIRSDATRVRPGDRLLFLGTGGGVPLKSDTGAVVQDSGEPWRDYLVADTDTSAGASGEAPSTSRACCWRCWRVAVSTTRGPPRAAGGRFTGPAMQGPRRG